MMVGVLIYLLIGLYFMLDVIGEFPHMKQEPFIMLAVAGLLWPMHVGYALLCHWGYIDE